MPDQAGTSENRHIQYLVYKNRKKRSDIVEFFLQSSRQITLNKLGLGFAVKSLGLCRSSMKAVTGMYLAVLF